jgi:predicted RNase H-like HicB family nuclease
MEELKLLLKRKYFITLYWIKEKDGGGFWLAYHPDFGHSACSATGDTPDEAIAFLGLVRQDVIKHYWRMKKTIPEPSVFSFESCHNKE